VLPQRRHSFADPGLIPSSIASSARRSPRERMIRRAFSLRDSCRRASSTTYGAAMNLVFSHCRATIAILKRDSSASHLRR